MAKRQVQHRYGTWIAASKHDFATRQATRYALPGHSAVLLVQDPVVVYNKNKRHEDVDETKGPAHYNHMIRSMVRNAKTTIVPDFFKPDEGDSSEHSHK